MNLFKRGMIFVTFLGSCIAMALLVASLGTKQWVNARATRLINPFQSNGTINFGLFDGKKELNFGFGWRRFDIDVIHQIKYEPEFLIYLFWLGTVVCVSGGLFFSVLSTIFAAVNTATTTSKCLAGTSGLYLWNFLALLVDVIAISFWIAQFYLRIQHNVLSREDKTNEWTSEGMAELGYSFWFVVGAAVVSFINIIVVFIANSEKEMDTVVPVLEEKTNGAIMLY